jgi:hypothetical protein
MPAGVSRDEIEARAYAIWEAEGRPHGKHEDHWRKAHEELNAAGKSPVRNAAASAAGTTPSTRAPATRAKKTTGKAK